MPRAVTALAAALLALVGTATLALAQGGTPPTAPPQPGAPTRGALYEDGQTGRYLLGGRWYFRLDPTDQGETQGLPANPALDGWTPVHVPNAWNATDESDASQRGTIGWYRKDFVLPPDARHLGWKLRFESVNYRAKVWLNGRLIGEHEGAYVPWELTPRGLRRNGTNTLVVRVDSRRGRGDIPRGGDRANGRPGGGWWNYGGILREVYLRSFDRVDIPSVRVRTKIGRSQRRAWLSFRVGVENPTAHAARFRIQMTIDGATRDSRPRHLRAHGKRSLFFRVEVPNPRLWAPLAPELYKVQIRALRGSRELSGYDLHVGIRDIRVSDDGLLLINGRRAKLFGVSIHEDRPTRGAALTPADRRQDMERVGELGAALIRSHYPLHPRYLELADRMGVMVWDEVPVYSQGYKGFEIPGVTQKALAYVRAMVARDQNHASVLAWSIGNELSARMTEDQIDYIRRGARLLNQLDPTRLRTIDIFGWPQNPPADVYYRLDALGINNYFGWYPGPNGQSEDRDRLGPYLDQMRDYYPELALFVSEFGAEANRSGDPEVKGTYEFQQQLLSDHIRTYRSRDYLNGAIAWILRDFRVRPDWEGGNPTPQPPWNQKGLTDQYGNKKPAFATTAQLYRARPAMARHLYRRGNRR